MELYVSYTLALEPTSSLEAQARLVTVDDAWRQVADIEAEFRSPAPS